MIVQDAMKPEGLGLGLEQEERPVLSVVIASVNGWEVLEPTLRALDSQADRERMEVIVVEAVGGETRHRLRCQEPAVVLVEVVEKSTIPRLRYLGVKQAQGEIIAILEDHGEVAPDWAEQVLKAHQSGDWGAVGGSVENGQGGLVNWSAFFCEYTPYMGPVAEGPCDDLPGNNIAYRRSDLLRHAEILNEGKWESWINDRLCADGVPLRSTNRMVVHHIKGFRLGHFLSQRFHFARSFAGMRRVDQSWLKRLVYGIGSLALPALLLARVSRKVWAKGRHRGKFVACLPLVALFLTVGALGEMLGYLFGAGRSLERVE